MSGCGFVVLLGVFERLSGQNVPLEVYIGVLALLVCVSFYLAWREERIAYNSATRLSEFPEFRGKIEKDIIQFGKTKTNVGLSNIALVVSFVNVKDAKANIESFELTVVIGDKEYKARNVPANDKQLVFKSHDKWGLPYFTEDYQDLTQFKHIPHERGVIYKGWLLFVLTEVIIYDALDCIYKLAVIDAFGRANHLEQRHRSKHKTDLTELLTVIEQDAHTKLESEIKSLGESHQNLEKRQYKIEKLRELIIEDKNIRLQGSSRVMRPLLRHLDYYNSYETRAETFLRLHYGEAYVVRFSQEGANVLEELLSELLDS